MNTPKISVITVSFNHAEFIKDNIESVLRQNYPNFEHLIIDGGSTDGTLDILRSYPHLKWTSEPDRNQSHALNKGFSKATGDIIAWLNSDDWYADGTFDAIVPALKEYPVVLTGTEETDRAGRWRQTVPNVERSYHDLLRYWVPYAWLAQNGVFFTRALLEEVKYADGHYVEEDLNLCMDYDLWLRMARKFPFKRCLEKVCGYYRVYGDNKTGRSPMAVQKEFGRVYRRHLLRLCKAERTLTFILPVSAISQELSGTLDALTKQTFHNFDVLFADYCSSKEESEALRKLTETLCNSFNSIGFRYCRSRNRFPLQAANEGIANCFSPIAALIWPGDFLPPNFSTYANDVFSVDAIGIALPLAQAKDVREQMHHPEDSRLRFDSLLRPIFIPANLVARTEALRELGGFRAWQFPAFAMRELVLRMFWKGWYVSIVNELSINPNEALYGEYKALLLERIQSISAKLICDLDAEFSSNKFAAIRARGHWMPLLPEGMISASQEVLASAGAEFRQLFKDV